MIQVTRLNGSQYFINAEQIYSVEATPDTVITLLDSNKVIVREKAAEVADRIVAYYQKVRQPFVSREMAYVYEQAQRSIAGLGNNG
jgi:flagellar protein FlbD